METLGCIEHVGLFKKGRVDDGKCTCQYELHHVEPVEMLQSSTVDQFLFLGIKLCSSTGYRWLYDFVPVVT